MNINTQQFVLKEHTLDFDPEKSILRCADLDNNTLWLKKLNEITFINSVSENGDKFFISCQIDDLNGKFAAVYKENGATAWFIPGRDFLNVLYGNFLFLIFIDEQERYYLLKIEINEGNTIWHQIIKGDLENYTINSREIILQYKSGRTECLNTATGQLV